MNSTARITVLGFLALALIAAVVYGYIYMKDSQAEAALVFESAEARSGSDTMSQSIRTIQTNYGSELETMNSLTISKSEIVSLVSLLEKAGRDMGLAVTIASISSESSASASTGTPETIRVVVDAEGAWSPSLAFARLIGSLPYKASVESVSLKLTGKSWRTGAILKVTIFPENI